MHILKNGLNQLSYHLTKKKVSSTDCTRLITPADGGSVSANCVRACMCQKKVLVVPGIFVLHTITHKHSAAFRKAVRRTKESFVASKSWSKGGVHLITFPPLAWSKLRVRSVGAGSTQLRTIISSQQ